MVLYDGITAVEIKKLSDTEVWSLPNNIIIAAFRVKWRAPVYAQCTVLVCREINKLGGKTIWFCFTCKTNPVQYKPQSRRRGEDSSGTKKFNNTAEKCNLRCPHYKLEWFRLHGYSESEIHRMESPVYSTYEHLAHAWNKDQPQSLKSDESMHSDFDQPLVDGWLSDDEIGSAPNLKCSDTLRDYLSAPLVPITTLRRSGLLAYWYKQQRYTPQVANFALSILGAPSSSVDAERAFSGDRLTVNHLQHSMGDLTFEAKMAVGSWYNTPLLPSVDAAAAIISERLRHSCNYCL